MRRRLDDGRLEESLWVACSLASFEVLLTIFFGEVYIPGRNDKT